VETEAQDRHRAVFLDRDGVINASIVREGKPYPPWAVDQFELLPGVAEACKSLRGAGFALVVATNQPDVGRGTLAQETVEEMHRIMCEQLPIDQVEVCYEPGGQQSSEFRKPRPGMLLKAARELDLDLAQSFMVGDRWRRSPISWLPTCLAPPKSFFPYKEIPDYETDR
jgi:D-glycero-D-manno-heptose 1,7-bisphosphate phosphatase